MQVYAPSLEETSPLVASGKRASGVGIVSAVGAGVGAAVGSPGAAVGAAVGAGIGAAVG